ncbi:hypothetical protein DFJ73DRAFT_636022 [Zopfochytrium polystomum]|nr:hypothetical protein DFJ73DRAFT_636022 [Zopfochytrium polystomum]
MTTASATQQTLAVVAGVGPGIGAAVARAFAARGHAVALLARNVDSVAPLAASIAAATRSAARPFACDITSDASIHAAFDAIAVAFPEHRLQVAVFNASNFTRAPFLDTTRAQWDESLNIAGGAFTFSQLVLSRILAAAPAGQPLPYTPGTPSPTLIFTGATAALRGAAEFSTFAAQKFAIRALSQSLAREFGPRGVHVVHAVMEGLVAGEKVDRFLGPATVEHSRIEPESVARAYVYAAEQDRSAWTQEMDLRPFAERF